MNTEFYKKTFPVGTIIEVRSPFDISTKIVTGFGEYNDTLVLKETHWIPLRNYDKEFIENYELGKTSTIDFRDIEYRDYIVLKEEDKYILAVLANFVINHI